MFQTMDQSTVRYIPLLRSFGNILSSRIYKDFVRDWLRSGEILLKTRELVLRRRLV